MKIKPLFIYIGLIIVVIILLIIFTNNSDKQPTNIAEQMPQDEIHKGLSHPGMGGPSGANVSGEVKKKLEFLRTAYEINKNDTLKAREYAEFLAAAHKPNDAIPIYENILKKDNKRTDIRFSLALIYFNKQDFMKAEQIISEVLKYDINNGQAKYNLGAIAATKGEKEKAKKIWEELIIEHSNTELSSMAQEALNKLGI